MSYGNLIELSVDASVLEERLADIDSKLADLGGEDILDEDAVQRLINAGDFATAADLQDYPDEDRVEEIVRHLVHSEGDDFVQSVVDGMDLATESYVDDAIRDIDEGLDEDAVRTIVESATDGRLHTLEQRIEEVDNEADNRIGSLANLLGDANKRIEALQTQQEVILRDMNAFAERNDTAMTFFGLLKQAMALLRN